MNLGLGDVQTKVDDGNLREEILGDVGSQTETKQERISRLMEELDGGEKEWNWELTGRRLERSEAFGKQSWALGDGTTAGRGAPWTSASGGC
jgi:hypothetical protein